MGILFHDQALCVPQGHLWKGHPILQTSRLPLLMVHLFLSLDHGFSRATTPVAPVLDATEMQEMPYPRPPSVAGQQGDLQPQEYTEIMDLAVEGKILPEAGPVQPRPTLVDPADVGIDIRDTWYILPGACCPTA